jgi:signal transduction histidine kinase
VSDALDEEAERRWRHGLRNELNVITMAVSTALAMLEHGADPDRVREHLKRAEAGCRRCRNLVIDPTDLAGE